MWKKLIASALLCASVEANAAWQEPWREPQDTAMAFAAPDEYAWRLFVALNWPANIAGKTADPSRPFGAEGPVVWETWKFAPDVFRPRGVDPGPWIDGTVAVARRFEDAEPAPLQQIIRARQLSPRAVPAFDPDMARRMRNETRLNKDVFEFVRTNELYNIEGQLELVKQQKQTISFPLMGKETKAQWRAITSADKPRYHWTEVQNPDGSTTIFGLTSLHITTKDLPNWFWATFEHVDNPTRPGNLSWMLPSRDVFACKPPLQSDCNQSPTGIGLENTKWVNYRLRGTQINFTDSMGNALLLANSQPESTFQLTSSCMTCHARSSIGLFGSTPKRLSVFKPSGEGFVGAVDPNWFSSGTEGDPTLLFTQLDFVWSLSRARSKQTP
jgi:hypothetical protein